MWQIREAFQRERDWLAHPKLGGDFVLQTDASDVGIGASIFQGGAPVAHISAGLKACQKRWPIRDRELYAIVYTLRRCRWLRGGHIQVQTDHESLAIEDDPAPGATSTHYSELRWATWIQLMCEFDLVFSHIPGTDNTGADGQSRHPVFSDISCACVECKCWTSDLRKCKKFWFDFDKGLRALKATL
jgi:hypothetical protein